MLELCKHVFAFLGHELNKIVFRGYQHPNKQNLNEESPLKILKLGNNRIHSLSPDCFEYLTKLEVLELHNNPLSVIDQNTEMSLGFLSNLQVNDFFFIPKTNYEILFEILGFRFGKYGYFGIPG